MIRVTLLGCGGSAGVPQLGGPDGTGDWGACDPAEPRNRRTRSSIVIESTTGDRLLVDAAPDMRAQLLACAIPRIDAILFTHAHADHILGLDDIRILNRIVGRPLDAFAEPGTFTELDRRFDYAFRPWQPPHFFRPVLRPHPVPYGGRFETCGLLVQTFEQRHGAVATVGIRVADLAYCTDVAGFPDGVEHHLTGLDTWIVDCFQRQRHHTHANVEQVIAWFERLRPRRMVLTHMGYDLDYAWLRQRLPPGIEPGYDGMVIESPAPDDTRSDVG